MVFRHQEISWPDRERDYDEEILCCVRYNMSGLGGNSQRGDELNVFHVFMG